MSDEAPDPDSATGRAWLKSAEGRAWLRTAAGASWIAGAGRGWFDSADGQAWLESLPDDGFADYFAGKSPAPPEGAMTPATAPPIGARVRFVGDHVTSSGVAFSSGELAVVDELRLAPIGCVFAGLRTLDGRKLLTGYAGTFEAA